LLENASTAAPANRLLWWCFFNQDIDHSVRVSMGLVAPKSHVATDVDEVRTRTTW
jgi:hypothetical protein